MKLTFIGSGDAFGSGGRFQTCLMLTTEHGMCLLDCGATSMTALKRGGVDPNAVDTILITHLHGDHFGGIPFFVLDAQFSRRTRPLMIAGPPGLRTRCEQAMEVFFPGSSEAARKFEIEFVELEGGQTQQLGELTVTPFEVVHACGATPFALKVEVRGKRLLYSGDTEWTDSLLAAAGGADLFVCEAYSYDKKIRWHLDHAALVANATRLKCDRVVLTHMGPQMLEHASESPFERAYDGLEIVL